MEAGPARRGTGGGGPANARERKTPKQLVAKVRSQKPPGAHVLRLLLRPERRRARRAAFEQGFQLVLVQRIKLLDSQDSHIVALVVLAMMWLS